MTVKQPQLLGRSGRSPISADCHRCRALRNGIKRCTGSSHLFLIRRQRIVRLVREIGRQLFRLILIGAGPVFFRY